MARPPQPTGARSGGSRNLVGDAEAEPRRRNMLRIGHGAHQIVDRLLVSAAGQRDEVLRKLEEQTLRLWHPSGDTCAVAAAVRPKKCPPCAVDTLAHLRDHDRRRSPISKGGEPGR